MYKSNTDGSLKIPASSSSISPQAAIINAQVNVAMAGESGHPDRPASLEISCYRKL
jgi:hypothetical protein